MGKSWRPEKINMRVTTSHYEIYLITGQNSHLPSQNVFLQSLIYSTKRTIIWHEVKVVCSTVPPFLHRRDNNDCRPLHGTWRTLCMNKHLINKAVGRTQKTSFPLSSISKASLCSDFKTNPSSCASKSRQSTSFRAEKRSAQASTHPLSQAQGGLFRVLTRADKCWAVKRALRSSFNVWCGVGLARALFPRFRCAWMPAKFSLMLKKERIILSVWGGINVLNIFKEASIFLIIVHSSCELILCPVLRLPSPAELKPALFCY